MQSPPLKRFRALDSLRGIAALIVVLHHLELAVSDASRNDVLHSFLGMGGRFAVMLFFVLSGFVLALPYFAGTNLAYGPYFLRRACRLYPPYAFAILVSALLCYLLGGTPLTMGSDWLKEPWSSPVTWDAVMSHLLATGIHRESTRLDGPIWSLIIEMRMSIIFPLLVLYVARFKWGGVAVAMLAAFLCSKAKASLGDPSTQIAESLAGSILLTIRYVAWFLLGAVMAAQLDRIKAIMFRLPVKIHWALFIGIGLMWVMLAYLKEMGEHQGYVDLFCGAITMYLIALCVAFPKVSNKLSGRVCLWMGDISYSLYLIHLPVLLAVFYLSNGRLPLYATLAVSLPAMLIAGHLMHHMVERPSMTLGRKLTNRLLLYKAAT